MSSTFGELVQQVLDQGMSALDAAGTDAELRECHREFLSKSGRMTGLMRELGRMPKQDRAAAGEVANRAKLQMEQALADRQSALLKVQLQAKANVTGFDPTLPYREVSLGHLHPSTITIRRIVTILRSLGFQVYESPEVETDEYNFELLNMPQDHPARDMWDTFHTTTPGTILRTHTSPGQIHAMRQFNPEPIRIISAGKCYRYEEVSARSETMFHQVEGIAVGRDITFRNLKWTLLQFVDAFFGPSRKLRLRKSYFPFTEPSMEVDVDCALCGGSGCSICKQTGWLEVMGAGMIHPRVLANGGYDPAVFSGFAFGMGPERLTMLQHRIDDIRYFFSNDVRFLNQFE